MIQFAILLEQLPAEVITIILHSVPDVHTLLAFIAASPVVLDLYRRTRVQTFTSVVRNEIGSDLLRHAMFLLQHWDRNLALQDFTNAHLELNLADVQELLRQERVTRALIQACVDDELKAKVQLTEIEWLRLRRGFYNFRVAAKLSFTDILYVYTDVEPFYQQCTTSEILEMLYMLYCLRNRYSKRLSSLDEVVLKGCLAGTLFVDFEMETLFASDCADLRVNFIRYGPWTENIEGIDEECRVPARWIPDWGYDGMPAPAESEVDPIEALVSFIPTSHTFDDSEGPGYRWLQHYKLIGVDHDYHNAIPLGFMIWDNERFNDMDWAHREPPSEPIQEEWQKSFESYRPVEEQYAEARYQSPEDEKMIDSSWEGFTWRRLQASERYYNTRSGS